MRILFTLLCLISLSAFAQDGVTIRSRNGTATNLTSKGTTTAHKLVATNIWSGWVNITNTATVGRAMSVGTAGGTPGSGLDVATNADVISRFGTNSASAFVPLVEFRSAQTVAGGHKEGGTIRLVDPTGVNSPLEYGFYNFGAGLFTANLFEVYSQGFSIRSIPGVGTLYIRNPTDTGGFVITDNGITAKISTLEGVPSPISIEPGGIPTIFAATNGNVGLTTTTPQAKLHIVDVSDQNFLQLSGIPGTNTFMVNSNGWVGINTNPSVPLDILYDGGIGIGSTPGLRSYFANSRNTNSEAITSITSQGGSGAWFGVFDVNLSYNGSADFNALRLKSMDNGLTARVGINTTNPISLLHLAGSSTIGVTDFTMSDPGEAANQKYWSWQMGSALGSGVLRFRMVDDPLNNGNDALWFKRSGYSLTTAAFPNGNVGIGTTTPAAKLQVDGTTASTLFAVNTNHLVVTNRNVGIGIATPGNTLAVLGSSENSGGPILSDNTKGIVSFKSYPATSGVQLNMGGYIDSAFAMWLQAFYSGDSSAYPIVLNPLGGNVGIGKTAPVAKLDVNGNIKTLLTNASLATDGNGIIVAGGSSATNVFPITVTTLIGTNGSNAGGLTRGLVYNTNGAGAGYTALEWHTANGTTVDYFYQDVNGLRFKASGTDLVIEDGLKIVDLSGTGTRLVTADPDGVLAASADIAASSATFSGNLSARTNIAQFDVSISDFVIGTRYTNSMRRSSVAASFQLAAAVSGTAAVTLFVEQAGITNKLTISSGPLAGLTTIEPLPLMVGPGAFYYFTDTSSGAGASASIVAGTSSKTDW